MTLAQATLTRFLRNLIDMSEANLNVQLDEMADVGGFGREELLIQGNLITALEAIAEVRFPGFKRRRSGVNSIASAHVTA